MADQNIGITISARQGDLSGLAAIERRLAAMKEQLGAAPGGRAGLHIALHLRAGDTSGLRALQTQVTHLSQQATTRIAQSVTPGVHTGVLRALGYQALAGPYGGIQRVGYQGEAALPSLRQAMEIPPFVPVRPFVPTPADPARPRMSTIERLGLVTRDAAPPPRVPPPEGPPRVPPGEPPPEEPEAAPARRGVFATGVALGSAALRAIPGAGVVARLARGVGGLGLGAGAVAAGTYAAYQAASQGMQLYEQRARGILDVSRKLNLEFDETGETINLLRQGYHSLTRENLETIAVMGRLTGRFEPGAVAAAVGVRQAYGIAPGLAGGLAGTLAMRTVGPGEPLARALAGARAAYGRGGTLPMAVEPLLEDVIRIAGWGGAAAVPPGTGLTGAWAGLIGGLGQRYREPGQTADAFGRIAAGVTNAPDPTTQALRIRAIREMHRQRVARGQGHLMTFGEGEGAVSVDLRTIEGQRIAMEQAISSRDVLQAYWKGSQEQFGTTGDQAALGFEQVFLGGRIGPTEARRVRQRLEQGGGPAGLLREGNVPAELATEAERRRTIEARPEFRVTEQLAAALQAPLERLGAPLVQASAELKLSLADAVTAMQNMPWGAVVQTLQDLPRQLLDVLRQLPMLSGLAGSPLWPGGGPGGAGVGLLPTPGGGYQGPRLLPPGAYPELTPTRQAP